MKKLIELQKKLKPIVKGSENPFFKSRYFDINAIIETIKPIIDDLGIVISQPIVILDGKNILKTVVSDIDGAVLAESSMIIPETNDPQKLGSIITYYRRYSLQSLLFLQAEDDDGNRASSKVQTQTVNVLKLLIQNTDTTEKLESIFKSSEFMQNYKMLNEQGVNTIKEFAKNKKNQLTQQNNGNQSNQ